MKEEHKKIICDYMGWIYPIPLLTDWLIREPLHLFDANDMIALMNKMAEKEDKNQYSDWGKFLEYFASATAGYFKNSLNTDAMICLNYRAISFLFSNPERFFNLFIESGVWKNE